MLNNLQIFLAVSNQGLINADVRCANVNMVESADTNTDV